jgi:hypothetical protein
MSNSVETNWERDERILRTFCLTAEDAPQHSAIAKQTMKSKVTITLDAASDAPPAVVDLGDIDHVRALMAPLRQMLLEQDDQSFNKVANVLARRLPKDSELWKASVHNRAEWKKALTVPKAGIVDPAGTGATPKDNKLLPKEMFDLIAYSKVFHTKQPELERWNNLGEIIQEMVWAQIPGLLARLTKIAMAQRRVILDAFDESALDTSEDPGATSGS